MAAANAFGVTVATLQVYVSDLTINASSSPSTTQVTAIIASEAEALRGQTADKGIETDGMTSADPAYGVLAWILTYLGVAAVMRARLRGEDAAGFAREAAFALKRLRAEPQSVDENAIATRAESTQQWRDRTGQGSNAFARSTAGKIRDGGSL